jgi:hypothetical protein
LKPTKGATMKGTGGTASEPKDEPPAADAGQVPTEPGPDQPPGRSLSADIFISYSRKDIAFARLLRSSLESSGLNTWIDWERIPVGEQWWSEISQAIERCNVFMFIISASSIGSSVCKDEINEALKNHKRVIPVLVDNVTPEAVREFIPELPGLNWVVFEKDHLFRLGEDAEAAPGRDEDRLVALPVRAGPGQAHRDGSHRLGLGESSYPVAGGRPQVVGPGSGRQLLGPRLGPRGRGRLARARRR